MLRAARRHSREQFHILLRQLQWFLRVLFEVQEFSDNLEEMTDILEDEGCGHNPFYRDLNRTRARVTQGLPKDGSMCYSLHSKTTRGSRFVTTLRGGKRILSPIGSYEDSVGKASPWDPIEK
eukprot:s1864_g18.t1